MKLSLYDESVRDDWDRLVVASSNGTFLHSRRFLSYHHSRFEDCSILIRSPKGELVGVLPAAASNADQSEVVSHPGITYGGIVKSIRLSGADMLEVLEQIVVFYRRQGFKKFLYKPVPRIFQTMPSEDDLYALFRLGADRCRCDLSAVIDLSNRVRESKSPRSTELNKARRFGVEVSRDLGYLASFWSMLAQSLAEKYAKTPVHSFQELCDLLDKFPDEIALVTGHVDSKIVAGALVFKTRSAVHTQYLAMNAKGRETSALTCIVENCIEQAMRDKFRYFSFGISTDQHGRLNEGLHKFKTGFGAGGLVHEAYSIAL
jgi:hypothetical protein